MRQYCEEILNRNGNKMLVFWQINDLLIANILWKQKIENKYAFVAEERNTKNTIIDYTVYTRYLEQQIHIVQTEKASYKPNTESSQQN